MVERQKPMTELESKTWLTLGKGVLVLLLAMTVIPIAGQLWAIENDPAVCSFEVSGAADLTNLHFLPANETINGTIGQAGASVKGQMFCRDISRAMIRDFN